MYTDLEITRLRGIVGLEVRDLRRVNLIVGGNGSGKTTILEAVSLISNGSDPLGPAHCAKMRNSGRVIGLPLLSMFPEANSELPVQIQAHWEDETAPRRLTITMQPVTRVEPDPPPSENGFMAGPAQGPWGGMRLEYTPAVGKPVITFAQIEGHRVAGAAVRRADAHSSVHISARAASDQSDIEIFSMLVRNKQADEVIAAMRLIEPTTRAIAIVSDAGQSIVVADVGLATMLPLPDIGNGFERFFAVLVPFPACGGGVLMVDELDAGLHHGHFPPLWKLVDEMSRRYRVQVFVTTHNDELLRAALDHFRDQPGELGLFRVDRDAAGHRRVANYDAEMQAAVLREDFEVRG